MVIGHAQKVESGLLQTRSKDRGRSEGIAGGGHVLGAGVCLVKRSLQIAGGDIDRSCHRGHINEQLPPISGRQLHRRVGRTHHDISRHGDGYSVVTLPC